MDFFLMSLDYARMHFSLREVERPIHEVFFFGLSFCGVGVGGGCTEKIQFAPYVYIFVFRKSTQIFGVSYLNVGYFL